MKIRNFRDLNIWSLGREIVLQIYKVTSHFPEEEKFGLVVQMRRCVVSVPSNIAEGFNRFQNREYRRYLYIALGSCAELETQVEICSDLLYINIELKNTLISKIQTESKMITSLIKML